MQAAVASNWLGWSTSMRKTRRFASAKIALRNAELNGLHKDIVLLSECKILKESGQLNKALFLLEPIEQNILALESIIQDKKQYDKNNKQGKSRDNSIYPRGGYPDGLETLEKRKFYAERLFLATQCMAESKLKNAKTIVARYMCAVDLHGNETSHFEFGRYLESLYHSDVKAREEQGAGGVGANSSVLKGKKRAGGSDDSDWVSVRLVNRTLQIIFELSKCM
jgi:hypothetical protein